MEILKINSKNAVEKAAALILKGKVLVCPTDTVYGLICDTTNQKAVKKLIKIKKRLGKKPIPIFIRDIEMAKKIAEISKTQEEFLEKVWPGKVTVVLRQRKNCGLPEILFGDKKTIGLRIPDYKLINQLLLIISRPLTGTSANISGFPASTKIKNVIKQFQDKKFQPDLILNVGNLKPSRPSKVIDLTGSKPKILRK
ncbi:threonylcarbamoyl-AMP synthase [Patescibacteria group bacterium]|nr:threonylcarbamoyl-AMP synthase [Patescibacteria group bacterium]